MGRYAPILGENGSDGVRRDRYEWLINCPIDRPRESTNRRGKLRDSEWRVSAQYAGGFRRVPVHVHATLVSFTVNFKGCHVASLLYPADSKV